MDYTSANLGKDLNTSFTIPKMKGEVKDNLNIDQTHHVLANDYRNFPNQVTPQYLNSTYEPNSINDTMHYAMFTRRPRTDSNSSITTTQPMNSWPQSPIKRTWADANANSSTPANIRYKDTFGDLHDATLPKELLSLFQPLFCKLCMIQLTSNTMAKLHYQAKNHHKKVRDWLIEYSERTGEPLHKRAVVPRSKKHEEYDPKYYHCDVCDIPLTGRIHAESHYMGKNHQRALYGKKSPAGHGCYNDDGKWVRTVAAKNDPTGRDGFGQDFARTPTTPKPVEGALRCEICNVSVSSAPQLEVHLQGQKHKKKLKHMDSGMIVSSLKENSSETDECSNIDSELLSSYITPSGEFYCKLCNLTLNSEIQFMQHLKSKKHAKKSTQFESIEPHSADDILMHL